MRSLCGLLVMLLAGCGDVRPCRSGTIFVTARFGAAALDATTVDLTITVDSKTITATRSHVAGDATESFEIAFSTYPAGKDVTIDILARHGDLAIGQGHLSGSLLDDCTPLSLNIDAVSGMDASADGLGADASPTAPDLANPDLANPDLAVPDLATPDLTLPDLRTSPDLANGCVAWGFDDSTLGPLTYSSGDGGVSFPTNGHDGTNLFAGRVDRHRGADPRLCLPVSGRGAGRPERLGIS